jgi:hypothetical protein
MTNAPSDPSQSQQQQGTTSHSSIETHPNRDINRGTICPKTNDSDRRTRQQWHTTTLKCPLYLAFNLLRDATPIAQPTTESPEFDTCLQRFSNL